MANELKHNNTNKILDKNQIKNITEEADKNQGNMLMER